MGKIRLMKADHGREILHFVNDLTCFDNPVTTSNNNIIPLYSSDATYYTISVSMISCN